MVTSAAPPSVNHYDTRRLIFLFALAYFAQGLGQHGGLISQPLSFYLKQGLGFTAANVADYLAVLAIPWTIKPLYGLVSDYVPLLGYRRKTWLLLVNILAACGFLWLSGLFDAGTIIVALSLTAFGTAASDVIIDALMVENGQRCGMIARFQAAQWLWFKVAAILTALGGGFLASMFEPATALHVAATITMVAPLAVLMAAMVLVREERAVVNLEEARATTRAVIEAFRSPELRIAVAFLALWCFSPAFGTPMYYHMVDRLGFKQDFIGGLNALTAAGAVAGAWLFARHFANKTLVECARFSIFAAIAGIMGYMLIAWPQPYVDIVAGPLNAFFGFTAQIGSLTIFTLAARSCPRRAEGFVFAALMSVYNGVEQFSAVIGGRLYEHVFDRSLAPLLIVAAGAFLLCLFLVPKLARVDRGCPEPLRDRAEITRLQGDELPP